MKKLFLSSIALCMALTAFAQETYENTKMIEGDLNGTARYVGMGGAMEALGADISVISSNPAGIGLFRKSVASGSFGIVSQQDAPDYVQGNKTNFSFDQMGFVYAMRTGQKSYLNFGFNYRKSRNFNYILQAAGDHQGQASQNRLSFIKAMIDDKDGTYLNVDKDKSGYIYGLDNYTSQLDNIYYNGFIFDPDLNYDCNTASGYMMNRANKGYIGEYDFNLSGNSNDRFYWGVTIGIHDVHYTGISDYTEQVLDFKGQEAGYVTVSDDRRITGTGVDMKFGAIFRPIEDSPLRFGLAISTPTWYTLTTDNYTTLNNDTKYTPFVRGYYESNSYDFKLYTPWKFNLSAATTLDNALALGLSYEYADYGTTDTRYITGYSYDYYGDSYAESKSDYVMNQHTKRTLKGVSTLKAGAELRADDNLYLRVGYNYVSPLFQKDGFKDGSLDSYGSNYSSATDYTNWESTQRLTCGVGFKFDNFNLDIAYQYSSQNGQFHPFMDSYGDFDFGDGTVDYMDNYADAVKVSNKRHQILMTLGYRF